MQLRPIPTRLLIALVALSTLTVTSTAWGQDPPKKKKEGSKTVTKAIKKVDRQILSYNPAKAKEMLEPVMAEKDPRIDAALGQILILQEQYDEGIAKLQAAARSSDDPVISLALGDAQVTARKRGEASSTFEQVVAQATALVAADPNDTQARFALGAAQQRLKQYDEAISHLTQAKAQDATNPRIPFELGLAQMSRGDNQAAFDQLTSAIEMYSGYAYAYYYRALAANQIGRKDITVNDLDRFLALAPNAPEASKATRILASARG